MKRYKFTLQSDNGVVYTELNASDMVHAKKILLDLEKCPPRAIKKIEVVKDYEKELEEKKFKQFKEKVSQMTLKDFTEFEKVMFRAFNFINILEDMDIEKVNNLQGTPKEDNISMTSKELMEVFRSKLSMDIE